MPVIRTLYSLEQGCEDPWLFFETKRGPRAKKFGKRCCTPALSRCREVRIRKEGRKKERKKERKKILLASVMSVCSSIRMEKLGFHWTDFYEI